MTTDDDGRFQLQGLRRELVRVGASGFVSRQLESWWEGDVPPGWRAVASSKGALTSYALRWPAPLG